MFSKCRTFTESEAYFCLSRMLEAVQAGSLNEMRKQVKDLWVSSCLAAILAACGSGSVAVTGVTLDHTTLNLAAGDASVTLTPTVSPGDASNKKVSWSVDKPEIASISAEGIVSPISAGTAVVTVRTEDGDFTASCTIKVTTKSVAVTSVGLDHNQLQLVAGGDTATLTAIVSPSNATNKHVRWETDKSDVASITAEGVVSPKSKGTAVVTVTTEDGGFTAKCTIDVTAPIVGVTGLALDRNSLRLVAKGDTATLTITVSPSNATNKDVTWSSDAPAVATVSNGVVTPVAHGQATITVITADGSKTASCVVTVESPAGGAIQTSSSTSSYVSVADLSIPQSFTLEAWVKPSDVSTSAAQYVVSKQKTGVGKNQFRLGFESGRVYFMMTGPGNEGGLWNEDYQLATPVASGEWMHLAVTKNNSSFALYVNGVRKATFDDTATYKHEGTELFEIGSGVGREGPSDCVLDGALDEIRIWDVARTSDEIATDWNKTIPSSHPKYSNLVAYYRFDEENGDTALDAKSSHPGTLVNGPSRIESTAPFGQ